MNEKMKEEMKAEALERIDELCDEMGLNPNVYKYFNEGKLYYSYLTAGGLMGSIDTINYDERYAKAVKVVEELADVLVYHVIETTFYGNTWLSMLYVSKYKNDWQTERLEGNMIYAFVCSPDSPSDHEVGTIVLSSKQGALIRIG